MDVPQTLLTIRNLQIIATGVSEAEYMERYAEQFCEWVEGNVIKMSPVHERHDKLSRYAIRLLETFFELRPIGHIRIAPFVMRCGDDFPKREPDIQIVLSVHAERLQPTFTDGPADIVIEIVSPGSIETDRGDKFSEYERCGVSEYWIFDPLHRETMFYRLNEDGIYMRYDPDTDGNYRTPTLPGFVLHVPTLWQEPLPTPTAVVEAVKAMLS
ncbi:MAG: Uma2 family endonuclease [Anaerolineae bacterium]|nr:Uma2 family endonuclease [Anaerolineae bacterium]